MARDASGSYFLPGTINPVIPGSVIAVQWANPTMNDLATALTDSLSRTGKGGMGAPLVMNGYKITTLGAATLATDAAQAIQVRDSAFSLLAPAISDATGNDYTGVATLVSTPVAGTTYMFLADKTNTGPMTLAVNGGSALSILINAGPVPAGLVVAGSVVVVSFFNLAWRLANAGGVVGTINTVVSDNLPVISITNDVINSVATLNIHANVANGLLQLDSSNKVPVARLPFLDLEYIGEWNATPGILPVAASNGQFYIIVGPGNLTLYRVNVGNVYTPQVTAVVAGESIVYRGGSVDVNQPDGWYWIPASATPILASNVVVTPTPTFPAAVNAQQWFNQADPAIAAKLPLAGGTMTGPILQPAAPGTATALANKQYVDDTVAAVTPTIFSFNGRTGAVTLLSADVTGALGYTPANTAGEAFTGTVSAPTFTSTGFYTGMGFSPIVAINPGVPTLIDYNNGQTQIFNLAAPITITAINNVPVGGILRIVFSSTTNTITWPAGVLWPLGALPNLALGPFKLAIVVLENVSGGIHLANATAY